MMKKWLLLLFVPATCFAQTVSINGQAGQSLGSAAQVLAAAGLPSGAVTPSAFTSGVNFLFQGDSKFAGGPGVASATCVNGAGYGGVSGSYTCSIPGQVSALSYFAGHGTVYNGAVSGTTIAQMNTNYAANIHPKTFAVTGSPCIIFTQIGYNDTTGGTSLATMESGIQTSWTTAHTDGCTVVQTSIIPGANSQAGLAIMYQFNEFMRNSVCGSEPSGTTACPDKFVDFTNLTPSPFLVTPYGPYYSDNVHEVAGGWALFAAALDDTMSTQASVIRSVPVTTPGTGVGNTSYSPYSLTALTTGSYMLAIGDFACNTATIASYSGCIGNSSNVASNAYLSWEIGGGTNSVSETLAFAGYSFVDTSGDLTGLSVTDTSLTSGRCTQASTGGLLANSPAGAGAGCIVGVTTGNGVSATGSAGLLSFTLGAITPTTVTSVIGSDETVAFSATPTFSVTKRMSIITLTGNITSFTMAAGIDGQDKTLCFVQGSGSYTVAPPANVHGFFTPGTMNGKYNCQHFNYALTPAIWLADSLGVTNQ